jgi:hypothetical protein
MNRDPTHPLPAVIDPGWLFLVAGIGIIAATVLIPAQEDLDEARWKREVALGHEFHRRERINRYEEYVSALDRREPSLVYALAASQLNEIPEDRGVIGGLGDARSANVSVFPALEPPPMESTERRKTVSYLQKLTTQDSTRLWMLAGGMACVMIGMLPSARSRLADVRVEG